MSKEAPKDDVKEGLWDFMHEVVLAKQAAFERIICKCRCQSNGTKWAESEERDANSGI